MAKENAIFDEEEKLNEDLIGEFDLDELEEKLQDQLEEEFADRQFWEAERAKIGSPENLGNVIMDVVWEQFLNQVAATAGEDFIKENHGLKLDLRDEAHIQTADNFAKGNIATHNYISKGNLEQNYDRYKNKPHKEFRDEYVDPGMNVTLKRAGELKKQGIDTVTDIYTGRQIPTETKLENGKNNPKAAQREHVISSAKNYENPSLQMANNNEELAAITNNPENLQGYTTAARNNRKSDKSSNEMDECDKTKHWEKANERAEEYIKQEEKKGEERLKREGLKTQKEEAFRIGGKALRAAIMGLLAELIRSIIGKLISWLRSEEKNFETFIEHMKVDISTFVEKLKRSILTAADTAATTIATAIYGPIVNTIKKVWTLIKQGGRSIKEAVQYIKKPENKNKPFGILMLEVGKIIMAGLTTAGALLLGEVIEKGLMTIPVFAIDIPLIGSLANIIGIFLGAVICGIAGALALNMIDRIIAKKQKEETQEVIINKGNQVIAKQRQVQIVNEALLEKDRENIQANVSKRHQDAGSIMRDAYGNIMEDFVEDFSEGVNSSVIDEEDVATNKEIDKASDDLDNLFADWI